MQISQFAPVFIPTLNRDVLFKHCVESLARCTHADKTDLFIALDYPLKESHWDGYNKINIYVETIQGFKSVNIIERKENFGAVKNYFEGNKEVLNKYDRIIFSEDDNEFSPNFLDYINKGLDKFEDDDKVLAVCGYNYPIEIYKNYKNNIYINKAFSAWGYGTWKNREIYATYSTECISRVLAKKNFIVTMIKYYGLSKISTYIYALRKKQVKYGDGAITITLLNENKYCVFPVRSKVRNHGHDGSGEHCVMIKNNPYIKQKIDIENEFTYLENDAKIDNKIIHKFKSFVNLSLKSRCRFWIKNIIFVLAFYMNVLKNEVK